MNEHGIMLPGMRPIDPEYTTAYGRFADELSNAEGGSPLRAVIDGEVRLYAQDRVASVDDCTDIFDIIEAAFPVFRDICSKPRTHLKTVCEVRRTDTVKRIGYEAIAYLAGHSEDWLAVTASGLKPARLLSRTEDEEYRIYENRVVYSLSKLIISYLKRCERDLAYSCEQLYGIMNSAVSTDSFGFDPSFSRAVRELMSGEVSGAANRDVYELAEKNRRRAHELLAKFRSLRSSRLYRCLRGCPRVTGALLDTNILLMDKRYNVIFRTWKQMKRAAADRALTAVKLKDTADTLYDHTRFCEVLFGFAAHTLGFEVQGREYCREADKLGLTVSIENGVIVAFMRDTEKRFMELSRGVRLPIRDGEVYEKFSCVGEILYWDNDTNDDDIERFCSLFKTRESRGKEQSEEKRRYFALKSALISRQGEYAQTAEYRVIVIPVSGTVSGDGMSVCVRAAGSRAETLSRSFGADLAVTAFPLCGENEQHLTSYAFGHDDKTLMLPLSIYDINSYRRLRNVIIRMIMSIGKDSCPCCGGLMRNTAGGRVCDPCGGLTITKTICPDKDCRRAYSYISFPVSDETAEKMRTAAHESFLRRESLFRYASVTVMSTENGRPVPVCPYCGKG